MIWMAEGCNRSQWDHTASILTMTANINRDTSKKRKPYQIADFHPYRKERISGGSGMRICKANKELLKTVVMSLRKQHGSSQVSKTTATERACGTGDIAPSA